MSSDIEIIEEQRAVLGSVPVKPYSLIVILLIINTFCPCQTLQRYKILTIYLGQADCIGFAFLLATLLVTGVRDGEGLGLQPKCDDRPNNTGIVLAAEAAVDQPRLRIEIPSFSRRILRSRPIPTII